MDSLANPIYKVFAKYLEYDTEFQARLIQKSFGKLNKEIDYSTVKKGMYDLIASSGLAQIDPEKYEQILTECDVDKNNKFNPTEILYVCRRVMAAVLTNMRKEGIFQNMINDIHEALDLNNNGSLEYSEVEPFLKKLVSLKHIDEQSRPMLEKIFTELDADSNKSLNKEELSVLISKVSDKQFKALKATLKL